MNAPRLPARRAAAGFTLLEIMIVIGLIAVIMGIVAANVLNTGDKAKAKLAVTQVTTLAGAIESYELDNGSPPDKLEDLVTQPSDASGWLGPYAKDSQLKDPWGNEFIYRKPGQGKKYDLISYGADAQPGGTGFAKDVTNE